MTPTEFNHLLAATPDDRVPCRSGRYDPDWWFSSGERSIQAAFLCETCPLMVPCAEIGWEDVHGTYGGLGPTARRSADPRRFYDAKSRWDRMQRALDWIAKRRARADQLDQRYVPRDLPGVLNLSRR